MKKILYVILHGEVNKDRYNNVKDTWGINSDLLFYGDYEDNKEEIIKVSDNKSYQSNEEKHVNIFKYLSQNPTYNYEWFFFCDDDTFVNVNKLEKLLTTFDVNYVHGQLLTTNVIDDGPIEYLSGGAGYLIHCDLLEKISKEIKNLNTGYADLTLGVCLKNLNIPILNYEFFKSQSHIFYEYPDESIKNYITFHYIKTKDEMFKLLNNI